MSKNSVYHPAYMQVVQKEEKLWYFKQPAGIVHSPITLDSDFFSKREEQYGLTKAKIVLEFRLITGGRKGYYLADMKRKKYFYCGEDFDGVRSKLLELGIGRSHPLGF